MPIRLRSLRFSPSALLLRPADLGHVEAERIAHDRVVGTRWYDLRLQDRFPMGRSTNRRAVQFVLRLAPSDLVAPRRELQDGIDLNGDGFLLRALERVMGEVVGVVVLVEELVRRAARVREQRIEHLLLDLGVAADGARIADKGGDFVALDALSYVGDRGGSERLGNGERVAELVDLDDVGDVAAAGREPDHPAREDQRDCEQPARCYLPVALAENQIGVSFIPFPPRFEVWIRTHRSLAPRRRRLRASTRDSDTVRKLSEFSFGKGEKRTNDEIENRPILLGFVEVSWG